jgi:DNA methylase
MAPSSLIVPARLGVDHYAAYPPELCRRIILGWSPAGICIECGEGRRPVSEERAGATPDLTQRSTAHYNTARRYGARNGGNDGFDRLAAKMRRGVRPIITGYACACSNATAPTSPSLVADPFGGSGTTAVTASVLGRIGVTVELSADYCRLARWRTTDPGERARALGVPKPPPVPEGQRSLFDDLESA